MFRSVLQRLLDKGVIIIDTGVSLFNWGEPFLHPQFKRLIEIVNDFGLYYRISSNASRLPEIDETLLENLDLISFSMSGFSQESYDRIHQLEFETVKRNIVRFTESSRALGFQGPIRINYHLYQFNIGEIQPCRQFAKQLGIVFDPYCAVPVNWWDFAAWRDNTMSPERMKQAAQDLLWYYIEQTIRQAPANHTCPQHKILAVDEKGSILTCCLLPVDHPHYAWGNVLDDDLVPRVEHRVPQETCDHCLESGLAFLVHNPPQAALRP